MATGNFNCLGLRTLAVIGGETDPPPDRTSVLLALMTDINIKFKVLKKGYQRQLTVLYMEKWSGR